MESISYDVWQAVMESLCNPPDTKRCFKKLCVCVWIVVVVHLHIPVAHNQPLIWAQFQNKQDPNQVTEAI